jgi:hypothetical protein
VRTFLEQNNISISLPTLVGPKLLRTNDQAIMAAAMRMHFSTHQLRLISECRLWLQVMTLAEITDIDGTDILPYAMTSESEPQQIPTLWTISKSTLHWPHIKRPNEKAWRIWRKALHCHTPNNYINLLTPLGNWKPNWNKKRTWYFLRSACGHHIQQSLSSSSTLSHSSKIHTKHPDL